MTPSTSGGAQRRRELLRDSPTPTGPSGSRTARWSCTSTTI